MTIGTSNRTALRYVAEVTEGTTPATPALSEIRYTGESLGYNISNTRSNEIRSDRNVADLIRTGAEAAGDINFEMSYGSFDSLLEAALCGTWTANVLENGTTKKSFTIQRHFQDAGATGIFNQFRGALIDSVDFEIQQGQVVTGKFGVKARSMDVTEAQIAGATFPAGSTTSVMSSVTNIANLLENAVPSTEFFRKLSLSIKNNVRGLKAIGTLGNVGMALGTCEVTGSIEIYFATKTMLERYINGTGFSLSFDMDDGTSNYTVLLPKVKFETGQVVSGGLDQDILFSGTIRGLYDSGEGSQIKITRVP